MKGFYDKILPTAVNNYLKPYGVRVGETQISNSPVHVMNGKMYTDNGYGVDFNITVHSVPITDQMRKDILQVQELFRTGEDLSGHIVKESGILNIEFNKKLSLRNN